MTTFPFLKIARDHGVSYGQIMRETTALEYMLFLVEIDTTGRQADAMRRSLYELESPMRIRQRAILEAIFAERTRRQMESANRRSERKTP